jgi:hypothetical protein
MNDVERREILENLHYREADRMISAQQNGQRFARKNHLHALGDEGHIPIDAVIADVDTSAVADARVLEHSLLAVDVPIAAGGPSTSPRHCSGSTGS